jgi:hypothetical protein
VHYFLIVNGRLRFDVGFRDETYRNDWDWDTLLGPHRTLSEYNQAQRAKRFDVQSQAVRFNMRYLYETAQWRCGSGIVANMDARPLPENSLVHDFRRQLEALDLRGIDFLEFCWNGRDAPMLQWEDAAEGWVSPATVSWMPCAAPLDPARTVKSPILPVLSQYVRANTLDIPSPLMVDMGVAADGDVEEASRQAWGARQARCVWRGSATGHGVTTDSNVRLDLVNRAIPDGLLDAKLTSLGTRDRVDFCTRQLSMIHRTDLTPRLQESVGHHFYVPMEQQRSAKWTVYAEGNSAASRLASQLRDFTVLFVETRNPHCFDQLWFTPLLRDGVHMIKVRSDLSDVEEWLQWCRAHDDACFSIWQNARSFFRNTLTPTCCRAYLHSILTILSDHPSV